MRRLHFARLEIWVMIEEVLRRRAPSADLAEVVPHPPGSHQGRIALTVVIA